MLASQRLAFRIARREALRYKGRSALSITLLGLPLLGVAIGATAYDTTQLSPEENAEMYLGDNEAYVEIASAGVAIQQMSWDSQYFSWGTESSSEDAELTVAESEILAGLPLGTWMVPYTPYADWGADEIDVETPDGVGNIQTHGYDLSDDVYEAAGIEFLEGSAPIRDQVALSEAAADYLELGVGDDLVVDRSVGTEEYEVSAIIEVPWDLNGRLAIGTVFPTEATGWLLDAPRDLTDDEVLALNELGLGVWSKPHVTDPPPSPEGGYYETVMMDDAMLLIYGLLVVVVIMEVILLAGPAFAISARRRTREFALMSATGATPAQIRTTVLAGGLLFGLIAALIALVLGIGLVAAARPLLEQLVGYRTPGLRVLPLVQVALVGVAIATGLLSALAAALSASRINVVAALMGRTPSRKGSKRWLVIGLVMVAVGIACGLVGVTYWMLPLMAAAIVLAQLGLVACTPALLALTAKLGRWLPLSPRMALREAGRNRGSAAPAIAAVLGVVAGGMAFSMVITADQVRNEQSQEHLLPQGTMTLTLYNEGYDGLEVSGVDWDAALSEVEPMIQSRLAGAGLVANPTYSGENGCAGFEDNETDDVECAWTLVRPEEHECSYWEADTDNASDEEYEAIVAEAREDPYCDEDNDSLFSYLYDVPASADPRVVGTYTGFEGAELDEAVAFLESGGVLVADPWAITDEGTVSLERELNVWRESDTGEYLDVSEDEATITPEIADFTLEVPAMAVDRDLLGSSQLLLSPGAIEQMEMTETLWQRQYLVTTPGDMDEAAVEALTADLDRDLADGTVSAGLQVTDYTDRTTFYMVLAVTGLCALIALGATAVSTGLIIAEQRRDMTTLGAVGAAPGLRKRFAMWQTVVIALFGAGLGTLAGILGYALIREALNRPLQFNYPFEVLYGWELPWAAIGITVLAVPLIAAVGALLFTRAKLPSERRLT